MSFDFEKLFNLNKIEELLDDFRCTMKDDSSYDDFIKKFSFYGLTLDNDELLLCDWFNDIHKKFIIHDYVYSYLLSNYLEMNYKLKAVMTISKLIKSNIDNYFSGDISLYYYDDIVKSITVMLSLEFDYHECIQLLNTLEKMESNAMSGIGILFLKRTFYEYYYYCNENISFDDYFETIYKRFRGIKIYDYNDLSIKKIFLLTNHRLTSQIMEELLLRYKKKCITELLIICEKKFIKCFKRFENEYNILNYVHLDILSINQKKRYV